jgi:uncharacterized protein (TIGR02453 family)
MARFKGFPPEALPFLQQLADNNNREWFQAHKSDYASHLDRPLHELVLALGDDLDTFSPGYQTDPKKAIYRIYRDVRFSANKQPYKTHVSASFFPKWMQKHMGGGYYFHFSATEFFLGGGVYRAGSKEVYAIRKRLSKEPETYRKLVSAPSFKRLFGEVQGERLKRAPKGFSPEDPAIDLLLGKQFLASAQLPIELARTSKLQAEITKHFKTLQPWIDWLNEAVRAGA